MLFSKLTGVYLELIKMRSWLLLHLNMIFAITKLSRQSLLQIKAAANLHNTVKTAFKG